MLLRRPTRLKNVEPRSILIDSVMRILSVFRTPALSPVSSLVASQISRKNSSAYLANRFGTVSKLSCLLASRSSSGVLAPSLLIAQRMMLEAQGVGEQSRQLLDVLLEAVQEEANYIGDD